MIINQPSRITHLKLTLEEYLDGVMTHGFVLKPTSAFRLINMSGVTATSTRASSTSTLFLTGLPVEYRVLVRTLECFVVIVYLVPIVPTYEDFKVCTYLGRYLMEIPVNQDVYPWMDI